MLLDERDHVWTVPLVCANHPAYLATFSVQQQSCGEPAAVVPLVAQELEAPADTPKEQSQSLQEPLLK